MSLNAALAQCGIEYMHAHPECMRDRRDVPADLAVTHQTQHAAMQLHAVARTRPAASTQFAVVEVDFTRRCQHQPDCQFGHGKSVGARGCEDGNAGACGRIDIDIGHAHTVLADHLECRTTFDRGSGQSDRA
jgi:hypothetical protein